MFRPPLAGTVVACPPPGEGVAFVKMRTPLVILASVVAVGLALAEPEQSGAKSCGEGSCGSPACWDSGLRVRPDMTRALTASCVNVASARVLTQPAHGEVSNVTADYGALHFDALERADSPRFDEAVFELTGYDGSVIERHVSLEVVPTSENSPPVCDDAQATQRSDGTGPVEVYMSPYCRDPDGDEMVIRGGPPGVHPDSPKSIPAGYGDSNWRYRTATFSGEETTTIWATDVLGARSADAHLHVTVGPGVDRPPECRPSSWGAGEEVLPIYSRPGATRRFGILCDDLDGDPFTASLSSPPERGALAAFDVADTELGGSGAPRSIDATYVPVDDSLEPDPFSVTASGTGETTTRMAITPRPLPQNGGGYCGWSGVNAPQGEPSTLKISCGDDDGDPLSAEIVSAPKHGTVTPAVITAGRFGQTEITIPYLPDPGYLGYDCVKVKVTDGNGLDFYLPFDIQIQPPWVPLATESPPALSPLPPLPPLPVVPAGGPHALRHAVEQALGTTAVKRLRSTGGAEVWARAELSRHDLLRYGRAPGLVVVCSGRCQITADSKLATGVARVRASRRRIVAAAMSGQPQVLSLAVGRAERRALRHARGPRAKFTVSIRPAGGHTKSLSRSVRVSR